MHTLCPHSPRSTVSDLSLLPFQATDCIHHCSAVHASSSTSRIAPIPSGWLNLLLEVLNISFLSAVFYPGWDWRTQADHFLVPSALYWPILHFSSPFIGHRKLPRVNGEGWRQQTGGTQAIRLWNLCHLDLLKPGTTTLYLVRLIIPSMWWSGAQMPLGHTQTWPLSRE